MWTTSSATKNRHAPCGMTSQGISLKLFGIFFRIGIGTLGGGYAMIPMMEYEIVKRQGWLSQQEFLDIIAVAQTSPGIFAANMSSHIGYKLSGLRGALLATLGGVLPSFIIILLIAVCFRAFKDIVWVEYAFKGIRPVVVALIAAPVFSMAKSAKITWQTLWIPILSAGLIYLLGVSPIYIILGAGLLGLAYGLCITNKPNQV